MAAKEREKRGEKVENKKGIKITPTLHEAATRLTRPLLGLVLTSRQTREREENERKGKKEKNEKKNETTKLTSHSP